MKYEATQGHARSCLYFYFRHGESTSTASQLTSPASQKCKDLNKVLLLLQDLGLLPRVLSGLYWMWSSIKIPLLKHKNIGIDKLTTGIHYPTNNQSTIIIKSSHKNQENPSKYIIYHKPCLLRNISFIKCIIFIYFECRLVSFIRCPMLWRTTTIFKSKFILQLHFLGHLFFLYVSLSLPV